jgi:ABC-2 type transport system ATP-binding protein
MIKIENLVKSYNGNNVLKGINLEVQEGEIYGFIGHNGAGKSTTMNILTGLIDFQSGKCSVNNREVKRTQNSLFKDIGYLPEDPKFHLYMNAWEYLSFIGTMGGDSHKQIKEKSVRLLELVKLNKAAKRAVGGYSRGMKQRLGIAVAMYHDPKVLFLDEPSSALDPEGRKDVVDIITELKERRKTIFLSTHILNDMERICDRVGILHDGKIVLEENLDDLMKKYVQPIYDVEFDKEINESDITELMKSNLVECTSIDGKKASIQLADIKQNGTSFIRLLADIGIPVVSMNLRKASLEEIFLKVVK